MTELTRLAASGVPEWVGLALTVLGIAASVARQQRRSARTQGERLGELERRAELERTRRLQVEAALLEDGLRLPYWPPDGPQQRRRAFESYQPDDDEDEDQAEQFTQERRIPVPPLPAEVGSRHRRPSSL